MQAEVHALLRELTVHGRTVFLFSHVLSEVERIAVMAGVCAVMLVAAVRSFGRRDLAT